MKPIVFTYSCGKYRALGHQEAVRKTWLGKWGELVDHRFLLGKGNEQLAPDEIIFDVPDDYYALPWKTHAMVRWVLDNGYDYVFKSDPDTYIHVPRLLASGYAEHDYIGCGVPCPEALVASGGAGYWLSRKACDIVANSDPVHNYEDMDAGYLLKRAGITLHDDPRYIRWPTLWRDDVITNHLGRPLGHVVGEAPYDPQWMCDFHALLEQNPCT